MPAVGLLRSTPAAGLEHLVTALREGLTEAGYTEGENVALEYRFADDEVGRLPSLASDLVQRGVAVIVGDSLAIAAAKEVASNVPMVFATGGDPVKSGLVASLNRPGGRITGVTFFGGELGAKRLELLREVAPRAVTIAALVIPNHPTSAAERQDIEAAARRMGQDVMFVDV